MYKTFTALLVIFWLMDILNLPFMEMFDTTYPLNTTFWFLVMLFIPDNNNFHASIRHYDK